MQITGTIQQDQVFSKRYTYLKLGEDIPLQDREPELHDLFAKYHNKRVTITVEEIEEPEPEEMVTVTYKELLDRADDKTLRMCMVNPYYLNEGGDPTEVKDINQTVARMFMSSHEFNARKHDKNS